MQFGLMLTGLAQQDPDKDLGERFRDMVRTVEVCDELGFDYVTMGQHFLSDPLQQMQAIPVLARLSAVTERMRLVPTLLTPHQSPVYIAEVLTTLDVISGGRMGVNFAQGYRDAEFEAFGVQRSEIGRRFEATVETVLALWSGEPVTRHEPWWSLDDVRLMTRPVQDPHPEAWVAANADVAIKRAARWGLPWSVNPHATFTMLERQIALYRETLEEHGHDPTIGLPLGRELYCGETRESALAEAGPFIAEKYTSYSQWGQEKALPGEEDFTQPLEELAAGRFILGSAEDCIEEIEKYRAFGIDRIHMRVIWPGMELDQALEALERFATKVMPAFRD